MPINIPEIENNNKIKQIKQYAEKLEIKTFLAGGALRDALQGRQILDLDIVIEGNPDKLVKILAKKWNAKVIHYSRFGTYVLKLKNKAHIDFATARKESYPKPGSLPVVVSSSIEDDLYRRDFSVNAMAFGISGPDKGIILDYYGGKADLKKCVLKVIHKKSFIDDPTRILRLARFMGRGYKAENNTFKLALRGKKYLNKVSIERIKEELLCILNEKQPSRALSFLVKWGISDIVLPGIEVSSKLKNVDKAKGVGRRLYSLLSGLTRPQRLSFMNSLKLKRTLKNEVETLNNKIMRKLVISGADLIKLGYKPGPLFKEILNNTANRSFVSRKKAIRFVIENYSKKASETGRY